MMSFKVVLNIELCDCLKLLHSTIEKLSQLLIVIKRKSDKQQSNNLF